MNNGFAIYLSFFAIYLSFKASVRQMTKGGHP
jgi:hypothetical protein